MQKKKHFAFCIFKFRWFSWFACAERYVIIRWNNWKISKKLDWNICTWLCSLFVGSKITMASMTKKYRNRIRVIRVIYKRLYAANSRKEIRAGKCHAIYQYATENSKYIKKFNQNRESSYLMHCNAKNLLIDIMIYHFLSEKKWKLRSVVNLYAKCIIKRTL